jgi:hypothetical protein
MIAVLFALPCFAQSGKQRTALDIGTVTVWLGMPRQEVVDKCASAGYKQLVSGKDHIWFVGNQNSYNVHFRDNRLVYADREWYAKGADAFQSTMAALGSLADRQTFPLSCIISHEPKRDPNWNMDRIFVLCGERSVLLIHHKYKEDTAYSVTESIGKLPPSKD